MKSNRFVKKFDTAQNILFWLLKSILITELCSRCLLGCNFRNMMAIEDRYQKKGQDHFIQSSSGNEFLASTDKWLSHKREPRRFNKENCVPSSRVYHSDFCNHIKNIRIKPRETGVVHSSYMGLCSAFLLIIDNEPIGVRLVAYHPENNHGKGPIQYFKYRPNCFANNPSKLQTSAMVCQIRRQDTHKRSSNA